MDKHHGTGFRPPDACAPPGSIRADPDEALGLALISTRRASGTVSGRRTRKI
jgi:hypothetical protein